MMQVTPLISTGVLLLILTNNVQSMFGSCDPYTDLVTISDKAQMLSNPCFVCMDSCFTLNTSVGIDRTVERITKSNSHPME